MRKRMQFAAALAMLCGPGGAAFAQDFAFSSNGHSVKILEKQGVTGTGGLSLSQDFAGVLTIAGTDGATLNGQAQVTAPADDHRTILIVGTTGNAVDLTDVKGRSFTATLTGGNPSLSMQGSEFGTTNIRTGPGAQVGFQGCGLWFLNVTCAGGGNAFGLFDTETTATKFVGGAGVNQFFVDHLTGGSLTLDGHLGASTIDLDDAGSRPGYIGGSDLAKLLFKVGPGGDVTIGGTKAPTLVGGAAKVFFLGGAAGDASLLSIKGTSFLGSFGVVMGAEKDDVYISGVGFQASGSLKLGSGDDVIQAAASFGAPFNIDGGPGNDAITSLNTSTFANGAALCAKNVEAASVADLTTTAKEDATLSLTVNWITGDITLVDGARTQYKVHGTLKCSPGKIAISGTAQRTDGLTGYRFVVTATNDAHAQTFTATAHRYDPQGSALTTYTFSSP